MSALSQLHHTSALLARANRPSLEALTQALLTDWAADPQAVDLEMILKELALATPGTSGPDLADRLDHLVWWDEAKLAGSHLGLEVGERSALGTAFELGVLLISTGAEHPHLQEASLSDIHESWVRHRAGDDSSRAASLRLRLVLLLIVEGKNSLAPDLYVVARRMPGDNNEGPPPIGVIPVRLHQALERVSRGDLRRDIALSRELSELAGLVARSAQDNWREALRPFDRKRLFDRYRLELRKALENTMGLLEDAAGQQAATPEALSDLREAASILVFRVFFVVSLERRRLLYTRTMKPGEGLIGLLAAGDQAKDSPFLYLQDLTAAIRGEKSVTGRRKRVPVAVKHASIFFNRPTTDFSLELQGWLNALDTATPTLGKDRNRLAAWDGLLARLHPLALGQVTQYEFDAEEAGLLGGASAHVQRILGDVYEQILAMIPARAGKGKSSQVQLTLDGKARKGKEGQPSNAKELRAQEKGAKSERKALGAHYTPEALVIEVVLAALEPVFAAAWERAGNDPKRYKDELLGLRVLDPAMGSAHFLTVTAMEIAREMAWAEFYSSPRESRWFEVWPAEYAEGYEHAPDPWARVAPGDREVLDRMAARHLQQVVEACCHGVDVKPLAVELGKLALWMLTMVERLERGVSADSEPPPLTFVDKNLRCGDSLRGASEDGVKRFLAEVYGVAGESQRELFSSDFNSLDDALDCLLKLHESLSRPATVVVSEATGLLASAGAVLAKAKALKPNSDEPQQLRTQLYEVARELEDTLRWTWDLAFLYDWHGGSEDDLRTALIGRAGTTESWQALLGGTGKLTTAQRIYRERVREQARALRAFHWPLEFYDVFHRESRGFDLIVANPPFLGDRGLRRHLGEQGVTYLRQTHTDGATPDLTGFFMRHFDQLLNERAVLGTVAPNTLAQAKNRRVVLRPMVAGESPRFEIYRACASRVWPGDASVHILTVHMRRPLPSLRGEIRRIIESYGEDESATGLVAAAAQGIASYLDDGPETEMVALEEATSVSLVGMFPRGEFDRNIEFLDSVPKRERKAVFAYLNNRDVQQQPEPRARRVIIDVSAPLADAGMNGASPEEQVEWMRKQLPTLFEELDRSVRRAREALPASKRNKHARTYWWEFEELRSGLRSAWQGLTTVTILGAVGKIVNPTVIPRIDLATGLPVIPTHQLFIVPSEDRAVFALLTSLLFETFTRRACSSLKSDLRFTPSEVFPYFPFPWPPTPFPDNRYRSPVLNVPAPVERRLTPPAKTLLDLREDILLRPGRHDLTRAQVGGPTDLYNLFDDPLCENPSIQRLRRIHQALELAILTEYGWQDLHGPWTFDRPWIDGTWRFVPPAVTRRAYLERLAALNHERAAAASTSERV